MKKTKKAPMKKIAAKAATKKSAKPAAKAKSAKPSTAARKSAEAPAKPTPYTPQPITGMGWAPFRYPLS